MEKDTNLSSILGLGLRLTCEKCVFWLFESGLYTNVFKILYYSLRLQINRIWIDIASWIDISNTFKCIHISSWPPRWVPTRWRTPKSTPDPPFASFSNDRFAAFEAAMAIYMPMLDVGNFFRGSTYSTVVLLPPFLPLPSQLVCRECIQIVFRSILNK